MGGNFRDVDEKRYFWGGGIWTKIWKVIRRYPYSEERKNSTCKRPEEGNYSFCLRDSGMIQVGKAGQDQIIQGFLGYTKRVEYKWEAVGAIWFAMTSLATVREHVLGSPMGQVRGRASLQLAFPLQKCNLWRKPTYKRYIGCETDGET